MVILCSKRKLSFLILIIITLCSCSGTKKDVSEQDTSITEMSEANEDTVIIEPYIDEPRALDELLKIVPERSVIWAQDKDKYYWGTFYIENNGRLNPSYQSSAARIEIQNIKITDHEMTVYFLFQYLGNEVSDKIGPERFFFFVVTTEQIEARLKEAEDGLFLKTLVTEIDKDDIE